MNVCGYIFMSVWADLCICEDKCNECVCGLIYEGMCMYKNVFAKINVMNVCVGRFMYL